MTLLFSFALARELLVCEAPQYADNVKARFLSGGDILCYHSEFFGKAEVAVAISVVRNNEESPGLVKRYESRTYDSVLPRAVAFGASGVPLPWAGQILSFENLTSSAMKLVPVRLRGGHQMSDFEVLEDENGPCEVASRQDRLTSTCSWVGETPTSWWCASTPSHLWYYRDDHMYSVTPDGGAHLEVADTSLAPFGKACGVSQSGAAFLYLEGRDDIALWEREGKRLVKLASIEARGAWPSVRDGNVVLTRSRSRRRLVPYEVLDGSIIQLPSLRSRSASELLDYDSETGCSLWARDPHFGLLDVRLRCPRKSSWRGPSTR